ncbi:MAG: hypothetical protein H0X34_13535 [Chthoniobacterales bacterium]|nr:hypothetical protein [Chthoniobacterales bacterium]
MEHAKDILDVMANRKSVTPAVTAATMTTRAVSAYAGLGRKDAAATACRRGTDLLPMSREVLDGA